MLALVFRFWGSQNSSTQKHHNSSFLYLYPEHSKVVIAFSFEHLKIMKEWFEKCNFFLLTLPPLFPALNGHVQYFACTSTSMLVKSTMCREGFPALSARVRFLSCVHPLVCNQRPFLCKLLPTVVTAIVTNAQMGLLVSEHGRLF